MFFFFWETNLNVIEPLDDLSIQLLEQSLSFSKRNRTWKLFQIILIFPNTLIYIPNITLIFFFNTPYSFNTSNVIGYQQTNKKVPKKEKKKRKDPNVQIFKQLIPENLRILKYLTSQRFVFKKHSHLQHSLVVMDVRLTYCLAIHSSSLQITN